jgi:hypothetical protein
MAYYPLDEQETTINYDSITKAYSIYTSVPKHIRRLSELPYVAIQDMEKDKEGNCIGVKFTFDKLPNASIFNR